MIIGFLIVLLFGLSVGGPKQLWRDGDGPGRARTIRACLSIEVAAVFGRAWFMYFLTMGGVLAALSFSANTAFAGFPERMARAIAL